jgi:WS/DGAT/MGAT family acyltransferase
MHHCMLDGGAGVNLMQLLLRAEPGYEIPMAKPFEPRPAPSRAKLAAYEVGRRLRTPRKALGALRRFGAENASLVGALAERVTAIRELTRNLLPASPTPINGALGPHRRVDWIDMPLDELSTLRHELGCSLNDLVLAIVAGALRRYLGRRGVELEGLDFRVSIPVNVRRESEKEKMGNRVSSWIVPMPLAEADPLAQLKAIRLRTARLKRSHQAIAIEMLMAAADELPRLVPLIARALKGQISMIVTNVPGPPIPLYLLGCRARNMQPLVPLFPGVGIGLALLSYNGTLFWGFLGDYDLVPDLDRFVEDVCHARATLEEAARSRIRPLPES